MTDVRVRVYAKDLNVIDEEDTFVMTGHIISTGARVRFRVPRYNALVVLRILAHKEDGQIPVLIDDSSIIGGETAEQQVDSFLLDMQRIIEEHEAGDGLGDSD